MRLNGPRALAGEPRTNKCGFGKTPARGIVIKITVNQCLNAHSQNRGLGLDCECGQEKCVADAGCGGSVGRGTGARLSNAHPARRLLPPDDAAIRLMQYGCRPVLLPASRGQLKCSS